RTARRPGVAAGPARDEEPSASSGAATADGGTAEPLPVPPSCPDPPCTGAWRRGRHRSADGVRACLVPGVIGISPGWQAATGLLAGLGAGCPAPPARVAPRPAIPLR